MANPGVIPTLDPSPGGYYRDGAGEEHHIRVTRLGLNWYQANITKYAERAYRKGQTVEDIRKIIKYAEMWLDRESPDGSHPNKKYVDQG